MPVSSQSKLEVADGPSKDGKGIGTLGSGIYFLLKLGVWPHAQPA